MATTSPPSAAASTQPPPVATTLRAEIEEWVRTIVFGLLWYFCIITFLVEAYKIPSQSMYPTLDGREGFMQGDRVLAVKALDQFRELRRGDIVVFFSANPADTRVRPVMMRRLVKRLVGFPGETIEIIDGRLVVDGKVVDDPPIFQEIEYRNERLLERGRKFVVPEGHYFVLGDNSGSSQDSRYWGPLPAHHMLGRALFTWWKPSRIQSLNPEKQKLK